MGQNERDWDYHRSDAYRAAFARFAIVFFLGRLTHPQMPYSGPIIVVSGIVNLPSGET